MPNKDTLRYRLISQRLAASLCAIVLVIESGCATPPPPNTQYQATLGRVAVVATSQEPEIKLEGFTHGKGEGAASGAGKTFSSCMSGAALAGPLALILGLVVCPIATPVGAIVGAVQAPSSGEVHTSEAAISTALAVKKIQDELREQVVAAALANGSSLVTVSPESAQHAAQLRDYRSLAAAGVDTVLEVTLTKVGTEAAASGFNPPLRLYMQALVRLIRTDDNAEVFATDYVYQGENLKLSEWSDNQAERLLRDLQIGYETFGTQIYDNIFLLYPFPDRKLQAAGLKGTYGLAPIYPLVSGGSFAADDPWFFPSNWTTVDKLQPTLRWQGFPRATDITTAPDEMGRVKNVRYDLVISREHNLAPAEVVYRREGLSDTVHTVETSLFASTRYFWTVRARFELDGRERVTEWGSMAYFSNNLMNLTNPPSSWSYRFKTP